MDLSKHVKTNNAARSGSQGSLRELNFTWAVVAVKTGNDEHFVGTLFESLGDDASSSQKHDDQDREWE